MFTFLPNCSYTCASESGIASAAAEATAAEARRKTAFL